VLNLAHQLRQDPEVALLIHLDVLQKAAIMRMSGAHFRVRLGTAL
jgi:hypothetical protein